MNFFLNWLEAVGFSALALTVVGMLIQVIR